ncbi:MAG: hypothetical protein DMG61_15580 [Acidobacteria bacterium]|nr:MAG: hypothetical protein DMG61_15580 [Acidobacteriota bacterium]
MTSRTAYATIDLILRQGSLRSGIRVGWGMMPQNVIAVHNVSIGGVDVAARDLLQETIDSMPRKMAWHLLLDPDARTYHFNLRSATHVVTDTSGKKVIEFLP